MKLKTRLAPFDLGDVEDSLVTSWSGGIYTADHVEQLAERGMLAWYMKYQNERSINRSMPASLTGLTGEERIAYGTNRKPMFNDCRHNYVKSKDYPFSILHSLLDYDPKQLWGYGYTRLGYDAGEYQPKALYDSSDHFRLFSNRAWWTMQPRFEGKLSMLNALYELKDFKEIAKVTRSLFRPGYREKLLKEFSNALKPSGKGRRGARPVPPSPGFLRKRLNPWELSNDAAGGLLTYNMALVPLVSDFLAICEMLAKTVAQAQNEFSDLGEQVQTTHYTEVLLNQEDSEDVVLNSMPFFKAGIKRTIRKTATLTYDYKYRRRNSSEAFMKYWGTLLTGEAIWNALPLSFLLDYFVGIADSFHAMDVDKNVDVLKHQYCESTADKQIQGLWFDACPVAFGLVVSGKYYTGPSRKDLLLSGFESNDYVRTVCNPSKGLYVPIKKKMTDMHLWNMAALARCFV